jgi:hypothetical protein
VLTRTGPVLFCCPEKISSADIIIDVINSANEAYHDFRFLPLPCRPHSPQLIEYTSSHCTSVISTTHLTGQYDVICGELKPCRYGLSLSGTGQFWLSHPLTSAIDDLNVN